MNRNTIEKYLNMSDFEELDFKLYNNSIKVVDNYGFGKLRGIIKDVSLVKNMGPRAWYDMAINLRDRLKLKHHGPDVASCIVYEAYTSKFYYYDYDKHTLYTMEQLKKLDTEDKL